jgi:hypothetical protein
MSKHPMPDKCPRCESNNLKLFWDYEWQSLICNGCQAHLGYTFCVPEETKHEIREDDYGNERIILK